MKQALEVEHEGKIYAATFGNTLGPDESQSSQPVVLGTVGKNEVQYGFTLAWIPDDGDKPWGYDLYFFDGQNAIRIEQSEPRCGCRFDTPEEAAAAAIDDLDDTIQHNEHELRGDPTWTIVAHGGVSVIVEY